MAAPAIIAQNGDNRFMIDAGKNADDLPLVRVYDILLQTYSDPILLGTLVAHNPGWVEPTAPAAILEAVTQAVIAKRY